MVVDRELPMHEALGCDKSWGGVLQSSLILSHEYNMGYTFSFLNKKYFLVSFCLYK